MLAARLTFRPPIWATLLLLAACVAFTSAGFWQLDRKRQKTALFKAFERGGATDPLHGLLSDEASADARYRTVRVRGYYDAERQILLDNIVRDGKAGYFVMTPLRTDGGDILVNRGWIVAGADRQRLPDVSVSATEREVVGRVDRLPRPGLRLEAEPPDPAAPWPRALLYPTAREVAGHLGYPVADYQLLLDPAAAEGFRRNWRPTVSGPATHLGYAVQWFAFAAAAITIYLVLNLKQKRP